MSIRLKDIAERANVSISTVSRVINNDKTKPASRKTAEKIWEIVNELGYTPNQDARNLIKGERKEKSKTAHKNIGCLYTSTEDSFHDPFFSHLGAGIQRELDNQGYVMSFALSVYGMDFSRFYNFMVNHEVDGLIVAGRFKDDILEFLKTNYDNVIYAGVNYVDAGFDEIICDGYKGSVVAMEYLIDSGHSRIGFMGDVPSKSRDHVMNEHRFEAYEDTLKKHGLPLSEEQIIFAEPYSPLAYEAMKDHLARTQGTSLPTALYCTNDATAIGAMKALQEGGFRIPGDISIVGFDDVEIASFVNPPLTTIRVPKEELGKMAVKVLIDKIESGRDYPVRMDLPFELIVRQSSDALQE